MTRLLMLDLDEHLVAAVTRSLQQEGIDVVPVVSVERAREEAARQHFDVALLDGDLIDAAQLAAFSELPVILTTSFLEPEGQHRFFSRAPLVRKPYTSAQLLSALRATCAAPSFQSVSLLDVLRRANSDGSSLALRVGRAHIFVEAGELVHAELDGVRGERALAEVLAQGAQAEVAPITERARERTIQRPFQSLMLDLLRHIEERELRESELGARGESTSTFAKGPRS
jgi:DNA-binding response OmpR family regulator